jgi:hypothetical protein
MDGLESILKEDMDYLSFFEQTLYEAIVSNTYYAIKNVYELYVKRIKHSIEDWQCVIHHRKSKHQQKTLENHVYAANIISSKLIQLRPSFQEEGRQLQFQHIAHFPSTRCSHCQAKFCFQCGEATWHFPRTCEEYLQKRINKLRKIAPPDPSVESLSWKIQNSKRCPNCAVFIYHEHGCHKMTCLYCGFQFCWICRYAWSEQCGFFKCGNVADREKEVISVESTKEFGGISSSSYLLQRYEPELGVPNIEQIQARISELSSSPTSLL